MNKFLVGCINNDLRKSNIIKTRFFLIEGTEVKDVTQELCEGVQGIANYKYKNGLAQYMFGCGLSEYLQNYNLSNVKNLDLNNTSLHMFTLNDLKHLLKVNSSFDANIESNLLKFMNENYTIK